MRPTNIEDFLCSLHDGQWFGWSDSKEKIYSNLVILDKTKTKPTKKECTDGLSKIQDDYDQAIIDRNNKKASAKKKLEDLGLTTDEIKEAFGI